MWQSVISCQVSGAWYFSTLKVSIELPVATRHRHDMTEKLLKATLNPNNNKAIRIDSTGCSWAPSSEFVSSSIPSWQILPAHAQPFRGARDLAFFLKVPLDSLLVWVSSEGSGEPARMRRLAWTFAARIGDKYQIRLTRSSWFNTLSMWKAVMRNLKEDKMCSVS